MKRSIRQHAAYAFSQVANTNIYTLEKKIQMNISLYQFPVMLLCENLVYPSFASRSEEDFLKKKNMHNQ